MCFTHKVRKNKMDNLSVKLVRGSDGSIDEQASRDAFASVLAKHIAEREVETATIAAAVNAVFDAHFNVSINMPALCTFALTKLNAQPQNHKVLHERITQYVRDNSQGKDLSSKDAADSVWERPDSLFVINKGYGGGVYRRADRVK